VRGRPEKKLILSRGGAYHGSTYLSASLNGRPRDRDWMDGADDLIVKLSSPDPFRRPKGMTSEAFGDFLVDEFRDTVKRLGAEKIGCFVGEPIQASGGVIVPPKDYLKRIREICRENEILFVSDEVVTGFGRLGHVFASQELFDIEPDMITFAKGVTSGSVPMGGVIASSAIHDAFMAGPPGAIELFHGYTYSAHVLACAAGVATLQLYKDEGLFERARTMAPVLEDALHSLKGARHVIDIRNGGLAGAVELEPRAGAPGARTFDTYLGCWEKGLLVRQAGEIICFAPALIVEESHIAEMVGTLRDVLARVD
jgi:adenosylmethionine-8-amino-7-oxononanoate aminotransferase